MATPIAPLRLTYEAVTASPKAELMTKVACHLGLKVDVDHLLDGDHRKLSGAKSVEIADRFRMENAGFLRRIEAKRTARRPNAV